MWGMWPAGMSFNWFDVSGAERRMAERISESAPTPCDRALAVARHPAFTPAAAARVTRELTARELVSIWHTTSRLMRGPIGPGRSYGYVLLRAAVLDELELRDPEAFVGWYVEIAGPVPDLSARRPRLLRRLFGG